MQPAIQRMTIRDYQPGDAPAFAALNVAWISKLFAIEKHDLEILHHPEETILTPGGSIVMAVAADGTAVGCCALIPLGDGAYELARMAVAEACRGQGIGRRVLERAVAVAQDLGAETLYLATNSVLANAVHLYESLGFQHVSAASTPLPHYQRSNVSMRLDL
jgi:putative acetyltransferase